MSYFDVTLQSGERFDAALDATHNSFIYVFEGDAIVDGRAVANRTLATLSGDASSITAGEKGARFLLVSGKPLGEPVVQYGPFVMNTREEIDQAMRDFQSNNFVRNKAWINRKSVTANAQTTGA